MPCNTSERILIRFNPSNLSRETNLGGVKLNTSLDYIDGGQCSVGNGTTDSSSSSTLEVIHEVIISFHRRGSEKNGSGSHDAS
jgi:hypothetical protein